MTLESVLDGCFIEKSVQGLAEKIGIAPDCSVHQPTQPPTHRLAARELEVRYSGHRPEVGKGMGLL